MLVPLLFFIKRLFLPSSKEGPPQPWSCVPPTPRPGRDLQKSLIYEQFLREFNLEERRYFSRLARECIEERNYPRGEELYQYCYFSTLKYRLERLWKGQRRPSSLGVYIYAQSIKELEYSTEYYKSLLEKGAFASNSPGSPSSWLEERMKEISFPPHKSLKGKRGRPSGPLGEEASSLP